MGMTTKQILQGIHDWALQKVQNVVYDISAAHPDGQGNPTPYADLTAALGTGGVNIPEDIRKGGMSIKFIQGTVQSYDNKYVQYFLTKNEWSASVANWEKMNFEEEISQLVQEMSPINQVFRGAGITFVKKKICLAEGHFYRIILPIIWTTPQGATPLIFYVDRPNGQSAVDTIGSQLQITNLQYEHDWLIKASTSGLYEIGVKTDLPNVSVQIIDVTDELKNEWENRNSLISSLSIGSIVNYAEIGQIPSLIEDNDATYRHTTISVASGDVYWLSGRGGNTVRLWAILDSSNRVIKISMENSVIVEPTPIVMPIGANKLIINFSTNSVYTLALFSRLQIDALDTLQEKLLTEIPVNKGSIKCGGDVGTRPTLETDTDAEWRHCVLSVCEGEIYKITGTGGAGVNYPLYSILDSDGRIIYSTGGGISLSSQIIKMPFGATQLMCNFQNVYSHSISGVPSIKEITEMAISKFSFSTFYKETNYGIPPVEDYKGVGDDYTWGGQGTLTSEVYNKYDTLLNVQSDISDRTQDVNDGYIYRYYIGDACDNQPLVMYELKPLIYLTEHIPTIFLLCGQHGFEKASTYGVWYLLNDIVNNSTQSTLAKYLREFVHLYIVPVANPSGWDANTYTNANGVNINRNWYVNGWQKVTEPASQATGDAPFDQPETAAIRDAIDNIGDINLLMDCHQNGNGRVTYENINWLDITKVDDVYYNKVLEVANFEISAITRLFRNLYQAEIGGTNELCGKIGNPAPSTKGYADLWAVEQRNIIGITHEGFEALPLGTSQNATSHKANSELLGNFIKNFLCYYSR